MTDEQWIRTKQNCAPDEIEQEETKEIKKEPHNFIFIIAFITILILIGLITMRTVKYKKSVSQTNIIVIGDTQGPK